MEHYIRVEKLEKCKDKMCYIYVFCTEKLSMYNAERAYYEIKAKFPEPEYQVMLEVRRHSCEEVDADEYFAKNSCYKS